MRRILSFIVVLSLVLGATSLFAAQADWNGYFRVKYRATSAEDAAGDKTYETYAWQKLELVPTWKLSDSVAVHALFFHQQFWGTGRTWGYQTSSAIQQDTGGYAGPINQSTNGSADPMDAAATTPELKNTLGVGGAWATLSFMEGKLGIDVGRRLNNYWGTGAFFGGKFAPDRVVVTYKTPGMGGMMIPFAIYEARVDSDTANAEDDVEQWLAGLIYVKPGKTLFGFTATYVKSGEDLARWGSPVVSGGAYGGTNGLPLVGSNLIAANIYFDYQLTAGPMRIKPIFEVVWATGVVYDASVFGGAQDLSADVLNFILKAELKLPKMITFVPEVIFQKAPKKATADNAYMNFWGVNEFCGSEYTVGNIFGGYTGGLSYTNGNQPPSTIVGKLNIQYDILSEFVKGLSAYTWVIYGTPLGKFKTAAGEVDDSDQNTVLELSVGAAYAIDQNTSFGVDFAWAQVGDYSAAGAAIVGDSYGMFSPDSTHMYLGMDLTVKF
jgi:hypothetical protein